MLDAPRDFLAAPTGPPARNPLRGRGGRLSRHVYHERAAVAAAGEDKHCSRCGTAYKGWGDTCTLCNAVDCPPEPSQPRSAVSFSDGFAGGAQPEPSQPRSASSFSDGFAGGAGVHLYVYDLWEANDLQYAVFQHGAYHGSIEVRGKEWYFGAGGGVSFRCDLGRDPNYRPDPKRLYQGFTRLTARQIQDLVAELSPAWTGDTYDVLSRNCCHFAEVLLEGLEVQPMPKWVNRAARELPNDALGFVARTGINTGARYALTRGAVASVGAVSFGAMAGPASIPALAGEVVGGRLGGHIGEAVGGDEGQETGRLAGGILGSVGTGAGVGAAFFGPVGAGIGAGVGALSFATGRAVDAAISNFTNPAEMLTDLGTHVAGRVAASTASLAPSTGADHENLPWLSTAGVPKETRVTSRHRNRFTVSPRRTTGDRL